MHSPYLRKHFPSLVEMYDDDFLNSARSVIVKNLSTEIWGLGLVLTPKNVNKVYVEKYIEGLNASLTDTLEDIVTLLVDSDTTRTSICLGIPNKSSQDYQPNSVWFWFDGSNQNALDHFGVITPKNDRHRLTNLRVVYDTKKDAVISTKEYYQHRNNIDTYSNYTYAGHDSNDVSLVHTQSCIHDYKSASMAKDVSGITSKLDESVYKFMSYKRSDGQSTGIYIGLQNRN